METRKRVSLLKMESVGDDLQSISLGKIKKCPKIYDYMSPTVIKKRNAEDEITVSNLSEENEKIVPKQIAVTKLQMKTEFAAISAELYADHNLVIRKSEGSVGNSMYDSVAFGIKEFLPEFPTFDVQQLRNLTADYISANFSMDHYKQYIGISEDIRLKYCDEVRSNKWGSMEVDLDALANAIKCSITIFIATPESYITENFIVCNSHTKIYIAYVPAALRFFRLELMEF